jgi:hypothetical protein
VPRVDQGGIRWLQLLPVRRHVSGSPWRAYPDPKDNGGAAELLTSRRPDYAHLCCRKNPDQPENRSTLREIFAWKYRLADVWLTAENNYYLKRVGLAVDGYRPKAPRINQESLNGDIRYLIPFDQAGFSLFFVSRSDLTGRDAQCGISARSRGRDQRV